MNGKPTAKNLPHIVYIVNLMNTRTLNVEKIARLYLVNCVNDARYSQMYTSLEPVWHAILRKIPLVCRPTIRTLSVPKANILTNATLQIMWQAKYICRPMRTCAKTRHWAKLAGCIVQMWVS